jgi:hypothetical protein
MDEKIFDDLKILFKFKLFQSLEFLMKRFVSLLILGSLGACATLPDKQRTEYLSTSIPFTIFDNRILVPVIIDGKGPFTFIFDTGGGLTNTITPEVARKLKLSTVKTKDETGAGNATVSASQAKVARYSVGGLILENQEFEILDLSTIKKTFNFPELDGIIGFNVLGPPITCIDYEKQILTFKGGSADCFPGASEVIPYQLNDSIPVIQGAVSGVPAKFYLDTGDRSAFTIFKKFAESSKLIKEFDGKPIVISGRGIGGGIPAKLAVLNELSLGSRMRLPNVLTRLPLTTGGMFVKSDFSGNIGNEALRRFNLIFDYGKQEVTFVKNNHFNDSYIFVPPPNQ